MLWLRLQQGAKALLILLVVYTEGLGFLILADIVLILINPSPCYVKELDVKGHPLAYPLPIFKGLSSIHSHFTA